MPVCTNKYVVDQSFISFAYRKVLLDKYIFVVCVDQEDYLAKDLAQVTPKRQGLKADT